MTQSSGLVSVVIIFFNESRFLTAAIESVFEQTYRSWELLLVDDGSTDGSSEIARDLAHRHPHSVRYLAHPGGENRGMSASRNLGVRHAAGEYVAFLDADDIWLPHKLAQQVKRLQEYPQAALVYGRTMLWYSWQQARDPAQQDGFFELGVQQNTIANPPELVLQLLENRCQTPTTCNALVRHSAVLAVGGFEESFRGMYEDQAFFLKLCLEFPGYVAAECWAWYRQRSDSCSALSVASGRADAERLALLDWFACYLRSNQCDAESVVVALRRARRAVRWPRAAPWIGRLDWMRHRCMKALARLGGGS
jgi:glycosyltransferase involved in cell wall biosynthesis